MTPGSRLTSALASVEAELWSTTPFAAFGFVGPAGDSRACIEIRNRQVTMAYVTGAAEVPAPFREPFAHPRRFAPLSPHLQPALPMDRLLMTCGLQSLLVVPVEPDRGDAVFWAALSEPRAFDDAEVASFAEMARRMAALARESEPLDALDERLTRIHALADVLPALGAALDIRDVFGPLAAIARRVLPHDAAFVWIRSDDRRQVRLHALSTPEGWNLPEVIDNPYADPVSDHWDFAVHHDLRADPIERDLTNVRMGLRSALRLPIRLDGRIRGVLDFGAFDPHRYSAADVPIARRIADYVMVALSHQQLADEARRAAAIRERAANREMLEELLTTLTGVLDIRQVWNRVSQISEKVITHDTLSISIPTDDGLGWIIHVATGALRHLKTPFEMPAPTPRLLDTHWDYELNADMWAHAKYAGTPSVEAGMRAMLSIPVWFEGRLRAAVNFYSATPGHFTKVDVLVGRRIADHIALALSHQRLVEEEGRNVELRARAANLELLDELLAALTDTGQLSELFDRVSAAARKVIPNDAMVVLVMMPDGLHVRPYASSGFDPTGLPASIPVPSGFVRDPEWAYDLIDDTSARPEEFNQRAASRGFRSLLRVPIRVDGKLAAGLGFMAHEPGVYRQHDLLAARRIADRFALFLARERQLAASKRADEASARASQLESRVRALTDELDARTGYRRVVGESASWRQVLTQATQVAATDTTVLLLGESGTGKEVIARFVHRASARHDGPFIALNCAALPEQLLEAELFGYERGAFTGAAQSKPGQLEQAAGGTLFLDEVAEMSPSAQAKFLRVLQEREFQRLGGTRVLRTDARIVAATNRDLQREMQRGTFREDLFYRLNVFAIRLPPLRDRRDDILPLSEAFLAEYGRSLGRPPAGVSRDARERLMAYHWPGNVRELRNILERAAILCEGGLITHAHLALNVAVHSAPSPATPVREAISPEPSRLRSPGDSASYGEARQPASAKATAVRRSFSEGGSAEGATAAAISPEPPAPAAPTGAGSLSSMERAMVEQALQNARFNKSQAAKALGLTRAQLYVRLRKYGLE